MWFNLRKSTVRKVGKQTCNYQSVIGEVLQNSGRLGAVAFLFDVLPLGSFTLLMIISCRFVYVWDTTSRRILYKLPGHAGSVNEVAFHPEEPISKSCWIVNKLKSPGEMGLTTETFLGLVVLEWLPKNPKEGLFVVGFVQAAVLHWANSITQPYLLSFILPGMSCIALVMFDFPLT